MYYNDKPIEQFNEDVLGRAAFAKNLATALTNLKGETYTIGLYGKWGSGKTSIINMMLKELENQEKNKNDDDKFIIVKFEPWNFSDNEQLINQFFIRLANKFRSKEDKTKDKIGDALINYSYAFELSKLIPFAGNVIAPILTGVVKDVGKNLKNNIDEKDIIKQKQYVIDRLNESGKNILIIIDDIDRLSSEQIRQVFQLVAYVANFPNTIYLLSFDKDVVVKSLEKVQEGNGEEYLEKVIQMPIQVPQMRENTIADVLFYKLYKIYNLNSLDKKESYYLNGKIYEYMLPYLLSIRDVNRLCNALYFKYKGIESEVNFADMLCLTFLEIHFNKIYEWIKNNKPILTGENNINFSYQKSADDLYNEYFSQFKALLNDNYIYDIEKETEKLIKFITYIFPYIGRKINKSYVSFNKEELLKENKVAHPDKFDRYFSLDIDNIDIRRGDIFNAINLFDIESFKEMLIDYDNKNISYKFLDEINSRRNEINEDRVKIILESLFDVAFEIKEKNENNFFVHPEFKAYNVILNLIECLPEEERLDFLISMVNNSKISTLQTSTEIIRMISWGYGRLTDNGEKRDYKKVITLDELDKLTNIFVETIKNYLEEFDMFSLTKWKTILDTMEYIDEEYIKTQMVKSFTKKINILIYLDNCVNIWIHRVVVKMNIIFQMNMKNIYLKMKLLMQ